MNGYEWRDAILSDACELEPMTKLVLLFIAKHMNASKNTAFPSQATIAKNLCISVRTVRRHLDKAQAAGWVRVKTHNFKSGYANEYAVGVPEPAGSDKALPNGRSDKIKRGSDKLDGGSDTMDVLSIPNSNPNLQSITRDTLEATNGVPGKKKNPQSPGGSRGGPSAPKTPLQPAPSAPASVAKKKTKSPKPTPFITPEYDPAMEAFGRYKETMSRLGKPL